MATLYPLPLLRALAEASFRDMSPAARGLAGPGYLLRPCPSTLAAVGTWHPSLRSDPAPPVSTDDPTADAPAWMA